MKSQKTQTFADGLGDIQKSSVLSILICAICAFCGSSSSAQIVTQQIVLSAQWNLVSVQVGTNFNPAQIQSGLNDTSAVVQSIWTYQPSSTNWATVQPQHPNFPSDLTNVVPGCGYWLKVSKACVLNLAGEPWDGALNLNPGWNLVGFPGLSLSDLETLELSSAFGGSWDRIQQVWGWKAGAGAKFMGYDKTSIPQVTELAKLEPGKGYWVYSLDPLALVAQPYVLLAADSDISPLQESEPFLPPDSRFLGSNTNDYLDLNVFFAGAEDAGTDLNGNGILDQPSTQDTLIFPAGVVQQPISVGNGGSSLANWRLIENISWLTPDITNGIVGTERDIIMLTVSRAGLLPGVYSNNFFTVKVGELTKSVRVILEVSTAAGDWKGYATSERVNGQEIGLGKVDLYLNTFMESSSTSETRFRSVINRELSLLFPRDVFMNGVFYAGNDFTLTTTFQMPTGDRNAPPYNTFVHDPGGATSDKDYDGNGVLDNFNPFPYDIARQITLLGSRIDEDRMEGTYVEVLGNMLPGGNKIFIDGTFVLNRVNPEPTLRSIYNVTSNTVVQIGGSAGSIECNTITIKDGVSVQGITVSLNATFPDPDSLVVTLISPDTNQQFTLHNQATSLASTYSVSGFTNLNGAGNWTLCIAWDNTPERGYFNAWTLNIEGLAYYSASGRAVDVNTNALGNVRVQLAGGNLPEETTTGTNGVFVFNALTENEYNLTLSRAGFQTTARGLTIVSSNINVGDIVLPFITVTNPMITAQPNVGGAPLNVNFSALIPFNLLATNPSPSIVWSFGDGGSVTGSGVSVSHVFTNAGNYTAVAAISGIGTVTGPLVTAYTSGPTGTNSHQLSKIAFIGSIASPRVDPNVIERLGTGSTGTVYQESKRDTAAFDIDRFPTTNAAPFTPTAEDTDWFKQVGTCVSCPADTDDLTYDVYPQPATPNRFRMVCTMGGYVFGAQPSKVGNFVLQAGRIED